MVKEFLSRRGVAYTLKNLNEDPSARMEFLRAGYLLPPVTVVDGRAVMGYQPDALEEILEQREGKRDGP